MLHTTGVERLFVEGLGHAARNRELANLLLHTVLKPQAIWYWEVRVDIRSTWGKLLRKVPAWPSVCVFEIRWLASFGSILVLQAAAMREHPRGYHRERECGKG